MRGSIRTVSGTVRVVEDSTSMDCAPGLPVTLGDSVEDSGEKLGGPRAIRAPAGTAMAKSTATHNVINCRLGPGELLFIRDIYLFSGAALPIQLATNTYAISTTALFPYASARRSTRSIHYFGQSTSNVINSFIDFLEVVLERELPENSVYRNFLWARTRSSRICVEQLVNAIL